MKYRVQLSGEERDYLRKKVSSGSSPAREILHAQVLLKLDQDRPNLSDKDIALDVGISSRSVQRIRERCCLEGMQAALSRKEQPPRPQKRKLTDDFEARLIAVACSEAPSGRRRWTLRLLSERVIELGLCDGPVSHESVRQALKKTNCDLTKSSGG